MPAPAHPPPVPKDGYRGGYFNRPRLFTNYPNPHRSRKNRHVWEWSRDEGDSVCRQCGERGTWKLFERRGCVALPAPATAPEPDPADLPIPSDF
jgi:hypothetical protein